MAEINTQGWDRKRNVYRWNTNEYNIPFETSNFWLNSTSRSSLAVAPCECFPTQHHNTYYFVNQLDITKCTSRTGSNQAQNYRSQTKQSITRENVERLNSNLRRPHDSQLLQKWPPNMPDVPRCATRPEPMHNRYVELYQMFREWNSRFLWEH